MLLPGEKRSPAEKEAVLATKLAVNLVVGQQETVIQTCGTPPPHLCTWPDNRKWQKEGKRTRVCARNRSGCIKAAVRLMESSETRGGRSWSQREAYFQPISFSANDGERNWKVVLVHLGSQLEPVSRAEWNYRGSTDGSKKLRAGGENWGWTSTKCTDDCQDGCRFCLTKKIKVIQITPALPGTVSEHE